MQDAAHSHRHVCILICGCDPLVHALCIHMHTVKTPPHLPFLSYVSPCAHPPSFPLPLFPSISIRLSCYFSNQAEHCFGYLHIFLTLVCLLLFLTPSALLSCLCYKAVISAVQPPLPPSLSVPMPLPITPHFFHIVSPPLPSLTLGDKAINSALHAYFTLSDFARLPLFCLYHPQYLWSSRKDKSRASLVNLFALSCHFIYSHCSCVCTCLWILKETY